MALFAVLETYLLSGITGNLAYDTLKQFIARIFQKNPVELFVDSIETSAIRSKDSLNRYSKGITKFRNDLLLEYIQNDLRSDIVFDRENFLDYFANAIVTQQLLELEDTQLTQQEYRSLVEQLLEAALSEFISSISQNQPAFNQLVYSRFNELEKDISQLTVGQESGLEKISDEIVSLSDFVKTQTKINSLNIEIGLPRITSSQNESSEVDYWRLLVDEINNKGFVYRASVIENIQGKLITAPVLAIIGEPGIGKTYLLGSLESKNDTIFISLKGKSPYQVYSYLANKIRILKGGLPRLIQNEEFAYIELENELHGFNGKLFIDDGDFSPEIVNRMLGLTGASASFVFALRSIGFIKGYPIKVFEVPPFSHQEISEYLSRFNASIDISTQQALIRVSNGNPLYLFYFSVYQIDPLPEGIYAYQEALWNNLSPQEQEILFAIAISIFPISLPKLLQIINRVDSSTGNLPALLGITQKLRPIINSINGTLVIFHPYFAEYVSQKAIMLGIEQIYHKILGELALQENDILPTAYHLYKANDKRANPLLLDASHIAIASGERAIATELLTEFFEIAEKSDDKRKIAHAHFGLANLYAETSKPDLCKVHAEQAMKLFNEIGQEKTARHIESWFLAATIDSFDADYAIEREKQIIDGFDESDVEYLGGAYVNLSNICVQTSRFYLGVEFAKKALDLFEKNDIREGRLVALTNIAACFGGLEDRDEQERYANIIINEAESLGFLRLKAAGLNNLAIIRRKSKNPQSAKTLLEECVRIGQELSDANLEVMNLNNLGNVYYDLNDYNVAEKCYLEAMEKAQRFNIIREQGRSYELIARIKTKEHKYDEVISLSESSISFYKLIHDEFRIACALEDLAWAYSMKGEELTAAKNYETGADILQKFRIWGDATDYYYRAAECWRECGENQMALECAKKGINTGKEGKCNSELINLYDIAIQLDRFSDFANEIDELWLWSLSTQNSDSLIQIIYLFMNNLKLPANSEKKKVKFKALINKLTSIYIENINNDILNAISLAIEQADSTFINDEELNSCIQELLEKTDGLYWRYIDDDNYAYTIGMRWGNGEYVQISGCENSSTIRKLVFCLSVILYANRTSIGELVTQNGKASESGLEIIFMSASFFKENIDLQYSIDNMQEFGFSISDSSNPTNPSFYHSGIVFDDYQNKADRIRNPKNNLFLFMVSSVIACTIGFFSHKSNDDVSRGAFRLSANILGKV